jgi:hypothetical protein
MRTRIPGCCCCPCHQPGTPPPLHTFKTLLTNDPRIYKFINRCRLWNCRICGNMPFLLSIIQTCTCNPNMPDSVLMAGKIGPFSVLPARSSPRVYSLMHHCTSFSTIPPVIVTRMNNRIKTIVPQGHDRTIYPCDQVKKLTCIRGSHPRSHPNLNPLPILHRPHLALSSNT